MRVLFLAAEAVPIVKVGGLGDVAGALPKALAALGHDVRVAIPDSTPPGDRRFAREPIASFDLVSAKRRENVEAFGVAAGGVTFQLIGGDSIRRDGRVYGTGVEEDGARFAFFSRAALELCRELGWRPDIVHANDSHTAPAAAWLAAARATDFFYRDAASLLTIHNLPYMGNGAGGALASYDIPTEGPGVPDWARGGMLAVGLAFADEINAVSPTYAREILTSEYGCGLEGLLASRGDRLSGILNGIDTEEWNPATDRALARRFDAESARLRDENRSALRAELRLEADSPAPLLAAVSRLDRQKGFDAALPAIERWLSTGGQFVLLGAGDPAIEESLSRVAAAFPGRASVQLRFDAALARRIYGGSDAFLIPSRYEPCGLTQMIAMRYGSLPVARETGGLADTVRDVRHADGTGILFPGPDPGSVDDALDRVRALWSRPDAWNAAVRNGMGRDFSWRGPARRYSELYDRARERR